MQCYLTAPTVPAAAGGTTHIPSGIRTIYNGTNWVCVTQVSAVTQPIGTTTSTSFVNALSGSPGTNPSVTLVTGTTALISIRSMVSNSATGAVIMGASVSGATTANASDDNSIYISQHTASQEHNFGTTFVISGLTAGTNTFTLAYRVTSGTGSYYQRAIIASGIA
jgi:hypothetical protein